mmetsp:Transcript_27907/g.70242  ORF Transcript_27907/g.70242 Transcript_27907/m.70242 type:complete len:174 (-) Transcript_27907:446-967(-)|eukprot:CAMPEP_0179862154 /NCGR_PEP_ID=MMETSP0982-20121206/14681_1 /TAXON_ID=483367 /ORGANISM="non described non described, Strain CCMP 2436" /LENGTH=173 /DNA_ID=CAMNT_0021749819 /DNA_START=394 /DNA_END=915 /DNA_ORIENTATION=-
MGSRLWDLMGWTELIEGLSAGREGRTHTEHSTVPRGEHVTATAAQLDNLLPELLALVAVALPLDDELAAALSCRRLHAAVASARLSAGRASSTTSVVSALSSVEKVDWAVSCGLPLGLPLGPSLCTHAAARGQQDVLSCLRAHGCEFDEWACAEAAYGGSVELLLGARRRLPV